VVPIRSLLLTIALYSSLSTTLIYNDIKHPLPFTAHNRVRLYNVYRQLTDPKVQVITLKVHTYSG